MTFNKKNMTLKEYIFFIKDTKNLMIYLAIIITIIKYKIIPIMSNTENKKKTDSKKQTANAAIHLIRRRKKNCFDCLENDKKNMDKKDGIQTWFENIFPCCSGDRNEECPDEDPDDKD